MIISIDTEVLSSVASLARSINEEISQISEIMKRVTTHDDWNCKERDSINEAIANNRSAQANLQEISEDFARSLTSISEQFLEAERTLPSKFQHIDSLIGQAVSIRNNLNHNENVSDEVISVIRADIKLTNSMECYELESLTDNINVCSFDQFNIQG